MERVEENLTKGGTKVYATSFKTLGSNGRLCIWVVDACMVVYTNLRGINFQCLERYFCWNIFFISFMESTMGSTLTIPTTKLPSLTLMVTFHSTFSIKFCLIFTFFVLRKCLMLCYLDNIDFLILYSSLNMD